MKDQILNARIIMKLCDKISWIIWHQMQEEREKRECPFNYCTWYKNALLSRDNKNWAENIDKLLL